MDLIEEARVRIGEHVIGLKVAVTFSPKLADQRCTLYPVEGVWDLLFCFLEHDSGVSLGVRPFDLSSYQSLIIPLGYCRSTCIQ